MRICFLADAGSIHTQRWAEYFSNRGHEVHLVSFRSFGRNDIRSLELHLLRRLHLPINLVYHTVQIRKLVKEIQPDILHAHYIFPYGFLGALSGFHPFVVTPLGTDISWNPERSKLAKLKVEFVFRRADIVHVSDQPAKDRVIELGCKENRIFVQPLFGPDTREFSPDKMSQELRERLGLGESPVIISIRKLIPYYDVKTLILAIPKVIKSTPEAKFIIGCDGEQANELRELAEELNISKCTSFVGYIPHAELAAYLASSDIFVDTYPNEYQKAGGGLGVGLMEAMSCGLAPIVSRRPFEFVIVDGVNGMHFQPRNAADLAEKIVFLLENEDKRQAFGTRNREIILRIGDWNENNEVFEKEVYLSFLSKPVSRAGR